MTVVETNISAMPTIRTTSVPKASLSMLDGLGIEEWARAPSVRQLRAGGGSRPARGKPDSC